MSAHAPSPSGARASTRAASDTHDAALLRAPGLVAALMLLGARRIGFKLTLGNSRRMCRFYDGASGGDALQIDSGGEQRAQGDLRLLRRGGRPRGPDRAHGGEPA